LAEGEVRELDKGTVQTLKTKARLSGGLSA
ncbi:MAG: hypothetical protein JWP91_817, partial [Fibrobacteres bacterium]|nr:hypothetical protein [Fibrobacterota bacterium]